MKTSVLLTWDLPQNYKAQMPFKVSGKTQKPIIHFRTGRKPHHSLCSMLIKCYQKITASDIDIFWRNEVSSLRFFTLKLRVTYAINWHSHVIALINSMGKGNKSAPLLLPQHAAEKRVWCTLFSVLYIFVFWQYCVSLNHELQILYNQHSVEVQGHLKKKLITQLQPDTEYSIAPTSKGNIAGGLQQQVSIRTAPDLINTKPITSLPQGGKMTINLTMFQNTALAGSVPINFQFHT